MGLLSAERDPVLLFELTRNRLERVQVNKSVVGVRLIARELPVFVPAARDLFDTRPQQQLPWPQLRERLRARLGDDAVHRIAPAGDPRPERAWSRIEGDGNAARVQSNGNAALVGVDHTFGTWRLGVFGGTGRTDFDVRQRGSKGETDSRHAGLYASTDFGGFGVRAGYSYTWHELALERRVAFAGLTDVTRARYDAEAKYFMCIKAGLLAYMQGYAPSVATEFARKALLSEVRPTFYEVEEAVAALPPV